MASSASDLLDSRSAASELGVSLRRVQQLIASGRLPAEKLGGNYVIRRGDLALVSERKPGRPWHKVKGGADVSVPRRRGSKHRST